METRWGEIVSAEVVPTSTLSQDGTRRPRKIVTRSRYEQTTDIRTSYHSHGIDIADTVTNFEGRNLQSKPRVNDFRPNDTISIWQAKKEILYITCILTCSRLIRSWNRTGDKWSHLPDVGDWLNL